MNFRKYKNSDAEVICSWIVDERALRFWSLDRYGDFPITEKDINENYEECSKFGNFYPMTLTDDNDKIIGHLILRNPDERKDVIRLGFIIVDKNCRGQGYGKLLINYAIKYAKEELGAKEINLGVIANNESAYRCYKACGFEDVELEKNVFQFYDENWDCIEMKLKE